MHDKLLNHQCAWLSCMEKLCVFNSKNEPLNAVWRNSLENLKALSSVLAVVAFVFKCVLSDDFYG